MFELLISLFQVKGQTEPGAILQKKKNILCLIPSEAPKINGVSIGLLNSPDHHVQIINGLNIELAGAGYLLLFLGMDDAGYVVKCRRTLTNNGITCGPTLFSGKVNGLSASILLGCSFDLNGVSLSLVNFTLYDAKGFTVGLVNRTGTLKGLQAGGFNSGDDIYGVQLGFMNYAFKRSKGLQLGLLNRSTNHRGFQLGLWNKNEKRSLPFINWQFKPNKPKET